MFTFDLQIGEADAQIPFFFIRDDDDLIKDDLGSEFIDLNEARHEAGNVVKGVVNDIEEIGDTVEGLTIEIAEDKGSVLATVTVLETRNI